MPPSFPPDELRMKENNIKHVEFIGGPEDGRILDASFLDNFEFDSDSGEHANIRLMMKLGDPRPLEVGDEQELQLLGEYVAKEVKDGRLRYEWFAKPVT